ncbi:MAG TPA: hypothetical protein VF618_09065 [Thermoanaerobaculia bacterium]
MATISIKRVEGKVVYDPSPLKLDVTSDFVVWANEDPDAAHQPTLEGQAADYWILHALPPAVAGQPAATSAAVNFSGYSAGDSVTYVDGLAPNDGSGTLTF